MAQKAFGDLLEGIVEQSGGDLQGIIIFDLNAGMPVYSNKGLKIAQEKLYKALFGNMTVAETDVIPTGFESLGRIQKALQSFTKVTNYGELEYSIFTLKEGIMMLSFERYLLPDLPIAICFLAPEGVNLGSLIFLVKRNIGKIRTQLKNI